MLTIHDAAVRLCDGLTRRDLLRVGGLSLLGLSWPALLRARQTGGVHSASAHPGKAKSCIVLFLVGGPPQHETWDPKPDAPAEVRGDFKPIATAVPGLTVGELLPRVARQADRYCVLRGVCTDDNAHSSSGYWLLTGYPHTPLNSENARPGAPNDWPCVAAVVNHLRPARGRFPGAITLPEAIVNNPNLAWPGQDAGFLGRAADPWLFACDPATAGFQVPELSLPQDVPPLRFDGRRALLLQVSGRLDAVEGSGVLARYDAQARQAFELLRAPRARQAFDLAREPPAVRDRYGRSKFGQSVLLARRLVEAGVSLVQVNWPREEGDTSANNPCWDTHSKNSERLKTALLPPFDLAFSALLDDLSQRGLLEETLVVCLGEFGRTPRINPLGGRDHWGHVFSVVLAGGGVRGGQFYGASDRLGGHPREGRVQPQDLTATIFHCLGISPETEIHDPLGRPVAISRGEVIRAVI